MPRHSSTEPLCPRCGGGLKRRHRSADEAREGSDFRRYRCTDAACGWDGILPRPARSSRRSRASSAEGGASRHLGLTGRAWALMGGLFVAIVIGASMLMHLAFREEPGLLSSGTPITNEASMAPKQAPALQPRK